MKSHSTILLLTVAFFIGVVACRRPLENAFLSTEYIEGDLPFTKIADLENNPILVGAISRFSFIDSEHFIILSNATGQVLVFNIQGRQIMSIGRKGRGEFEFLSPELVNVHDERIFIWCNQLLKFIVFDRNGNPLEEIFFERAIQDFVVWENLLGVYVSGGVYGADPILKVFDMTTGNFLAHSFGAGSNEHFILASHQCAGGLNVYQHYLYFSPIDRPKVYRVNLKDLSKTSFQINDPDFVHEKVETPASEFLFDPMTAIPYVFGSDIAEDIFIMGDHLVLMATVGDMQFEGMQVVDYSERRQILYLLDYRLNPIRKIMSRPVKNTNACLMDASANGLYAIKLDPATGSYSLHKLQLDLKIPEI